jgi:hypothetical protein
MNDLIMALEIFLKYDNPYSPTHCEHDELLVMINPEDVSKEDVEALDKLGFRPSVDGETFSSFRFGSA